MESKVSNLCHVMHRVTTSCLLHPLVHVREAAPGDYGEEDEEEMKKGESGKIETIEEEEEEEKGFRVLKEQEEEMRDGVLEMEDLMEEVFEAVTAAKRAYVRMQEAHCPWDPEKMRVADAAVVAEMRRLGTLRERWWRGRRSGSGGKKRSDAPYYSCRGASVVVGPYEVALEEMKREMRAKEAEVEALKEKLRNSASEGRLLQANSHRRLRSITQVAGAPTPELFILGTKQVKEASKSFTALLLSLMRSACCNILPTISSLHSLTPPPPPNHSKHAIESYINHKLFQGFENETFYLEGSLTSLLHPDKHRRDCFTQFCDMKAMDPADLLGILPTCNFGKFCKCKYLAMVTSNMEESLFGGLEQQKIVLAGDHPRTEFYVEFLKLAKAVWLLHLLAFALDPVPNQFEATRGADFHPEYMESVVKVSSGRVATSQMVVAFPVSPGFKLGRSVVKARVYLVPSLSSQN